MLHQALSLCSSLVDEEMRFEAAFFESVRVLVGRWMNAGTDKKISLPEMNARINELLKQSIKSDGVINLFSDIKEEFSLFDPKFLEEIAKMKEKNLAVELLKKLIAEQVHIYKRTNVVKSEKFSEIIHEAMNRYLNGMLTNEQVIEELLNLAKQIAAALFENVKGYNYGIQFASFYMPGDFIPHVRMMETGYQSASLANLFGLQYVVIRKPKPMDTATLNYSWQMNGTNAFSIYTNATDTIDDKSARQAVSSVLRFLTRMGILKYNNHSGYIASVINEHELLAVKTYDGGFYRRLKSPGDPVFHGDIIGEVIDPFEGFVKSQIVSQTDGIVFFAHTAPTVMGNQVVYKIIRRMHE